jgi:hypothetical protein
MALRDINLSLTSGDDYDEHDLSERNEQRWWYLVGVIIKQQYERICPGNHLNPSCAC